MSAVSRRDFLERSALAGLVSLAPRAPSPLPPPSPPPLFELDEATIAALQEGMRSGKYTARHLCELYLARIEAIDRRGPTLRAVIETNPDVLTIAGQLDQERKAGKLRGPLHGIPVLIKDNIATADRMMTTAGSLALAGITPPRDAAVAGRLRAAGAVGVGMERAWRPV